MSELKVFIAIIIYIGVFYFSTIYDYWRTDGFVSVAAFVVKKMTRDRYILLRKYIHYLNLVQKDLITIKTDRYK